MQVILPTRNNERNHVPQPELWEKLHATCGRDRGGRERRGFHRLPQTNQDRQAPQEEY